MSSIGNPLSGFNKKRQEMKKKRKKKKKKRDANKQKKLVQSLLPSKRKEEQEEEPVNKNTQAQHRMRKYDDKMSMKTTSDVEEHWYSSQQQHNFNTYYDKNIDHFYKHDGIDRFDDNFIHGGIINSDETAAEKKHGGIINNSDETAALFSFEKYDEELSEFIHKGYDFNNYSPLQKSAKENEKNIEAAYNKINQFFSNQQISLNVNFNNGGDSKNDQIHNLFVENRKQEDGLYYFGYYPFENDNIHCFHVAKHFKHNQLMRQHLVTLSGSNEDIKFMVTSTKESPSDESLSDRSLPWNRLSNNFSQFVKYTRGCANFNERDKYEYVTNVDNVEIFLKTTRKANEFQTFQKYVEEIFYGKSSLAIGGEDILASNKNTFMTNTEYVKPTFKMLLFTPFFSKYPRWVKYSLNRRNTYFKKKEDGLKELDKESKILKNKIKQNLNKIKKIKIKNLNASAIKKFKKNYITDLTEIANKLNNLYPASRITNRLPITSIKPKVILTDSEKFVNKIIAKITTIKKDHKEHWTNRKMTKYEFDSLFDIIDPPKKENITNIDVVGKDNKSVPLQSLIINLTRINVTSNHRSNRKKGFKSWYYKKFETWLWIYGVFINSNVYAGVHCENCIIPSEQRDATPIDRLTVDEQLESSWFLWDSMGKWLNTPIKSLDQELTKKDVIVRFLLFLLELEHKAIMLQPQPHPPKFKDLKSKIKLFKNKIIVESKYSHKNTTQLCTYLLTEFNNHTDSQNYGDKIKEMQFRIIYHCEYFDIDFDNVDNVDNFDIRNIKLDDEAQQKYDSALGKFLPKVKTPKPLNNNTKIRFNSLARQTSSQSTLNGLTGYISDCIEVNDGFIYIIKTYMNGDDYPNNCQYMGAYARDQFDVCDVRDDDLITHPFDFIDKLDINMQKMYNTKDLILPVISYISNTILIYGYDTMQTEKETKILTQLKLRSNELYQNKIRVQKKQVKQRNQLSNLQQGYGSGVVSAGQIDKEDTEAVQAVQEYNDNVCKIKDSIQNYRNILDTIKKDIELNNEEIKTNNDEISKTISVIQSPTRLSTINLFKTYIQVFLDSMGTASNVIEIYKSKIEDIFNSDFFYNFYKQHYKKSSQPLEILTDLLQHCYENSHRIRINQLRLLIKKSNELLIEYTRQYDAIDENLRFLDNQTTQTNNVENVEHQQTICYQQKRSITLKKVKLEAEIVDYKFNIRLLDTQQKRREKIKLHDPFASDLISVAVSDKIDIISEPNQEKKHKYRVDQSVLIINDDNSYNDLYKISETIPYNKDNSDEFLYKLKSESDDLSLVLSRIYKESELSDKLLRKKRKRGESFFTPLVDNSYGQNTPSEHPPSLLLTPEKPEKSEKSEKYTRGPLVTPENSQPSPPNPKKSPPRRTTYEIKLRF
jgi:hypothetical protein